MANNNPTIKIFLDWLRNTNLKKIVDDQINFEGLSLWSINKIAHKDFTVDNKWFFDLDNKLNKRQTVHTKKYFFLKLFKNLFFEIIFTCLFKIFIKKKK